MHQNTFMSLKYTFKNVMQFYDVSAPSSAVIVLKPKGDANSNVKNVEQTQTGQGFRATLNCIKTSVR